MKKWKLWILLSSSIALITIVTIIYGYFFFSFDYANNAIRWSNLSNEELEVDEYGLTVNGEKASDYSKLVLYDCDKPAGHASLKNRFSVEELTCSSITYKVKSKLTYRDDYFNTLSEYEKIIVIKLELIDFHWRINSVKVEKPEGD